MPDRETGYYGPGGRPKFDTCVAAERIIQDACWGGYEHDKSHVPFAWIDLIDERVTRLKKAIPVDPVVRLAYYRRQMIEIAALANVAYDLVDEV